MTVAHQNPGMFVIFLNGSTVETVLESEATQAVTGVKEEDGALTG